MKKKKTIILGAGESGVGAALLAQKHGHEVFVSDFGRIKENYREELEENNLDFEEGQHSKDIILGADEIIKSPGIPDTVPLVKAAVEKGIPVISEIEFAARYTKAKLIGITGSNGKTTTTNLTYHLLHEAGLPVVKAGNVGKSFARCLSEDVEADYFVLELSSFQLDGIDRFCPDIAVLLNITPDHLDRYDYKMENYARSKFRIAMNQSFKDLLILNYDLGVNHEDLGITNEDLDRLTARRAYVKMNFNQTSLLQVDDNEFDLAGTSLVGPHNRFNAECAIRIAQELGLGQEDIQAGLRNFKNDPHRLEFVANIAGVEYINDSKATNVDSTFFALQAMTKPVILIAGGTDKGNDYEPVSDLVADKVKALICLGVDNSKLLEFFTPIVKNIEEAGSVEEAVNRAVVYAESGDIVLLSPACASFDLFKNYVDRGDRFKEEVSKIKK